ncbi:MAG: hypothetical protein DCF20_17085 [Pseudanabaena sp.]|nr:MAG: hypothetical protein DCF20_17085 [Pseudanabaena sp.]
MILKPLLCLVFKSQKCRHTFVIWYKPQDCCGALCSPQQSWGLFIMQPQKMMNSDLNKIKTIHNDRKSFLKKILTILEN